MSDPSHAASPAEQETPAAEEPSPRPRKGPPLWVGLVFVLLLGGGFVVSQFINYTGPAIQWRHDYKQALAEAKANKKRLFLMLHEPNDPVVAGNDRELFSTRFVRERMSRMVPCRIVVKRGEPFGLEFGFTGGSLMLLIDPSGAVLGRAEGRVEERQFRTHFHPD